LSSIVSAIRPLSASRPAELYRRKAERAGYSNISAYIRAVTIGDEQGILQEIREDIKTLLKKIDNEE